MCANGQKLPIYIVFSQSSLSSSSGIPALYHPIIQYHFQDDPPEYLLPVGVDENVMILNQIAVLPSPFTVRSLSRKTMPTGVKIMDAPGATNGEREGRKATEKMYIIESTYDVEDRDANINEAPMVEVSRSVLSKFKQKLVKNMLLKQALASS